jgi:peptidoglycan-associated lipoprotein
MFNRRLLVVVLGVAVCALAMTGCKKKPRAGSGSGLPGASDIGMINPSDLDSEGLGTRPDDMTMLGGSPFTPVYFDYDSAQINDSERAKIEAVATHLRSSGGVSVIVEGHCDERGSNEYNLALGERRALAVRAYLVGLGIDATRIQTKSFGEERPAALGHDEASWSQNRRGEFSLFQ